VLQRFHGSAKNTETHATGSLLTSATVGVTNECDLVGGVHPISVSNTALCPARCFRWDCAASGTAW